MKLQRRYPKKPVKYLKTVKVLKGMFTDVREGCENIAMKRSKTKHK